MNLAEYRADLLVELTAPKQDHSIFIVEVQLEKDAKKRKALPGYVTGAWTRHHPCSAAAVILTFDESVADYYCQKIDLGFGLSVVQPWVQGPNDIPWIANLEEAQKSPELATLLAIAHSKEPGVEEVVFSAISALTTVENPDEGTRLAYYDIIRGSLNKRAKVALEKLMQERGPKYISDFAKHYYGQGLEKGREEGLEEMLITLLEARGFTVSTAVREILERCQEIGQFKTWAKQTLQANAIEEIFPELRQKH